MSYEAEEVNKHITSSDDWGISKFKLSNLSAIVKQFHFVAHENPSNSGDKVNGEQLPPTNHWSLLLTLTSPKLSSNALAVEVDVTPSEPGEPGMVVVESRSYAFNSNYTKTVSVDAAECITVADIFNLIIQKKRDRYIFAPVGEGCRFWLYTIADDFAGANFIDSANALAVQSALVMYWPTPKGTASVARPMANGQFFKSEDHCQ